MENRMGHREKRADKTGLEEMEMGKIFYLMGKSVCARSLRALCFTQHGLCGMENRMV